MKKVICVLTTSVFIVASAKCQNLSYGINPRISSSTLLEKNPQKKSDGTTQYNSLFTFGISGFLEKKINPSFSCVIKGGYNQKGFALPVQTVNADLNTVNSIQENRLHYVNLDIDGRLHFCDKGVRPYITAGMRAEYLVAENIGSAGFLSTAYVNPRNFDLGVLASAGVSIQEIVRFDLEANLDLLGPVRSSFLNARNLLFSFNMEVCINKLIPKKVTKV